MNFKVGMFAFLSVIAVVAFVSADYTGYLPYMTMPTSPFDYTFNVSIDETAGVMTFTGNENPLDVINVNYDEAQSFTKRINWVWFDGWFDNQNMYINQYIGTGTTYAGPATEVNPGVYQAEITLPNVPYYNIPLNMPFTIRIDTNSNVVQAWPTIYPPLVFEAAWDSQYGVAAQAFGPFLMEARLSSNNQQIILEEWIKEDLSTNGLSPRWTVGLTQNPLANFLALGSLNQPKKNIDIDDDGDSGSSSSPAADIVQPEAKQEITAEVVDSVDAVDELAVY